MSYDDGRTWRQAPVRDGVAKVVNPGPGRGITLRAEVTDKRGNGLEQTVHNAYRGR
ncbi:hypothetical protein ABZ714_18240 [Streptomyces sp. NPDC006798]|uniref:hypothetical protein n=1 Tax=Streptomyces sp. NPDC006798 TaxID=3155462 RepID=UPI0033C97B16